MIKIFLFIIGYAQGYSAVPYQKVYEALDSYPKIRQYRTNIENIAIREVGKKNLNYAYFMLKLFNGRISFTIKHHQDFGSFELTKDKSIILYNIEIP